MSANLQPETREELREAFNMFDKDKDGSISTTELALILKNLNQKATDEEIQKMIRQVDSSGDGEIDFEEFCAMMSTSKITFEEEMRAAFDVFDTDKSGTIDKNELREVLKRLGSEVDESDLDDMMKAADSNNDGTIDFSEFVNMMKSNS